MKENIIVNKSYKFALEVIKIYKQMLKQNEYVLSKQLLRSGTSIGANVEEAIAGISRKDFTAKMNIACKEARETRYWLRLIQEGNLLADSTEIQSLTEHADELVRILTSIIKTTQQNVKQHS